MADPNRVAGYMEISVNGSKLAAEGSFTYDLGVPKREAVVGPDAFHGYKEMPKVPYIEGSIVVKADTDVTAICNLTNAKIDLRLATGKIISLGDAYYAGEGTGNTDTGSLSVRFEAGRGQEV